VAKLGKKPHSAISSVKSSKIKTGEGRPGGCSAIAFCRKTVWRRQQAVASPVALPVPLHIGLRLQGLPLRPLPQTSRYSERNKKQKPETAIRQTSRILNNE
jgi:hypothetical protein